MNISSATNAALQALQSGEGVEDKRAGLQMALLKKSLQAQEDQAAELRKMIEGKGRLVDLSV